MKIWFISDTHNEHFRLQVPEVDLVIHCGDESTHGNAWMNEPEARRLFDWYSALDIESKELVQVGCAALRRHVEERIKPKIHAYGHLHDEKGISNYGMFTCGATQFINCSCCNLAGQLKNHGFVVEVGNGVT